MINGYSSGYGGPRSIDVQVGIAAAKFDLSPAKANEFISDELPRLQLPDGAEGWFAIPRFEAIAAKYHPDVTDLDEQYCSVFEGLLNSLTFEDNWRIIKSRAIKPECLRQCERTVFALAALYEMQKSDILIVPAQLGLRYRGFSPRRAVEKFVPNEFGLGAFAIAFLVSMHKDRFAYRNNLDIDCAGDEYAPGGSLHFCYTPRLLGYTGREMVFDAFLGNTDSSFRGTVTGFLPSKVSGELLTKGHK